jgi:ribose transport system permease protein
MTASKSIANFIARLAPILLLAVVLLYFSIRSPAFRTIGSARNILVQSSSVAIVAVGMTFVLLTGGIDLSVGAIMFVAAAIAGQLVLGNLGASPAPLWICLLAIILIGLAIGALNAALIARFTMAPFIVTLAMLFIGRGLALHITQTRALNLPPSFLAIGQSTIFAIPLPLALLALVSILGHITLTQTPYGRRLYALGNNPDAARKAGQPVARLIASVYIISGLCAAIAGVVSVAQLGAVSPTFGNQREFAAIAAAVVGGTSLFGGRGNIFPGTILGALLIQSVESGLNMTNANPYVYPVVIGAIIFIAALLDRLRGTGDDKV